MKNGLTYIVIDFGDPLFHYPFLCLLIRLALSRKENFSNNGQIKKEKKLKNKVTNFVHLLHFCGLSLVFLNQMLTRNYSLIDSLVKLISQ